MTRAQMAVSAVLVYHFLFYRKYPGSRSTGLSTNIGIRFDNYQYVIENRGSQFGWNTLEGLYFYIEGTTTERSKFPVMFRYKSHDTVTVLYRDRIEIEFKDRGNYFEVYRLDDRQEYRMEISNYNHLEVQTPSNSDYRGYRFDIEFY